METQIGNLAGLYLEKAKTFKTGGEELIKELGFDLDTSYDHDQFRTNRYRKGLLIIEFTYEANALRTVDLTIDETFSKPITFDEVAAITPVLGKWDD